MRPVALLFAMGVLVHGAWAFATPWPVDWDPAYYRAVALSILAGDGALTGSVWSLGYLPESIPFPADLHWMPLPSRVLVPLLALWNHGDQLTTVLLAATWGPLAWLLAGELNVQALDRWTGALLAVTGLWYAGTLSTPDSVALAGVVGSLVWFAAARGSWWACAWACAAFALVRNDGFLLAPFAALAFSGWRSIAVGVSGPAAWAAWGARCYALAGEPWLVSRRQAFWALSADDFLLGQASAASLLDRMAVLPDLAGFLAFHLVLILPLPALWVLAGRRERWIRAAGAYWLAFPVIALALAPAVAASGSLFRSGAALYPLACVLLGVGIGAIARWLQRARELEPRFSATGLAVALVVCCWVIGPLGKLGHPEPPVACDLSLPPETPAFSRHPLLAEARCGRLGVLYHPELDESRLLELSDRYGIYYVVSQEPVFDWPEEAPGVFRRPAAPTSPAGAPVRRAPSPHGP